VIVVIFVIYASNLWLVIALTHNPYVMCAYVCEACGNECLRFSDQESQMCGHMCLKHGRMSSLFHGIIASYLVLVRYKNS
jgi:hypothetical protein